MRTIYTSRAARIDITERGPGVGSGRIIAGALLAGAAVGIASMLGGWIDVLGITAIPVSVLFFSWLAIGVTSWLLGRFGGKRLVSIPEPEPEPRQVEPVRRSARVDGRQPIRGTIIRVGPRPELPPAASRSHRWPGGNR